MKRLIFFVAFMGLGTLLLLLVLIGEPERMKPVAEAPPEPTHLMDLNTVAIRQMDGRQLRWALWADQAYVLGDGRTASLSGVRFHLYESDGRTILMRGRSGHARMSGNPTRLEMEDGVLLEQEGKLKITTERLEFDQEKDLLRAPLKVRIQSPEGIQEGDSLEYSLADEKMTFTRPRFVQ